MGKKRNVTTAKMVEAKNRVNAQPMNFLNCFMRILAPINFAPVTTHTAEVAYERVLDYAGASLHRDWVDTLMVYDTRLGIASYTGKDSGDLPGIIDSQDDNRPANAPADWNP